MHLKIPVDDTRGCRPVCYLGYRHLRAISSGRAMSSKDQTGKVNNAKACGGKLACANGVYTTRWILAPNVGGDSNEATV